MADEIMRYPVFLTEAQFELLLAIVDNSKRGKKADRDAIRYELREAAGDALPEVEL